MASELDGLVSFVDAQRLLGNVSAATMRRREKAVTNWPKPYVVGRKTYYKRAEIVAYIEGLTPGRGPVIAGIGRLTKGHKGWTRRRLGRVRLTGKRRLVRRGRRHDSCA